MKEICYKRKETGWLSLYSDEVTDSMIGNADK